MERLARIDRRWIFVLIFLAVLVPFLTGLKFKPGTPSPSTTGVHEFVEKLPPRSVIMMAFDYGPASMPELQPMAMAVCRHAFRRHLRVICVALNPQGFLLADRMLAAAAPETGAVYTRDYVNLGFKPGYSAVILKMGDSIPAQYSQDTKGSPVATMPVMQGVHNYKDIGLILDLASSNSPAAWIGFAYEKYKVPLAAGITAVMATDYYPNLQAKQLVGLLNGLKGACEYEYLINKPELGALGMASQSIAHVVIILFVILGNVGYFAGRRKRR
jgi:hypothetical protein